MAGLYIHIPFCKHKCHYCNFYSLASVKYREEIIGAILRETELRKDYLKGEKLKTVYFGGGTPSLFPPQTLNAVIEKADRVLGLDPDPEITVEANPDDVDKRWLAGLRETPVNRLSLGVQSFNDRNLKYLSRIHSAAKAAESVILAMEAGFGNISIDLIYGIPEQSDRMWEQDLTEAVKYNVTHISAYALTVEPGTALHQFVRKGKYRSPNEATAASQFVIARKILRSAGYEHYEISNFCQPGFLSKHNTAYWAGEKYMGVGPSAHSFDGDSRQWNVSNLKGYLDAIGSGRVSFRRETLSESRKYNEYVMTALRTKWGIDLKMVEAGFGSEMLLHLLKEARPHLINQRIFIDRTHHMKLTADGKLFADGIASDLFFVG